MPERMREEAKALMEKWPVLRKGEMPVTEGAPLPAAFLARVAVAAVGGSLTRTLVDSCCGADASPCQLSLSALSKSSSYVRLNSWLVHNLPPLS